jgi:hypothetical protein
MSMAKAHVWHDISGKIVAVGRPVDNSKCRPLGDDKHMVLEVEIDEAHIPSLHQTHIVDPVRKVLSKLNSTS